MHGFARVNMLLAAGVYVLRGRRRDGSKFLPGLPMNTPMAVLAGLYAGVAFGLKRIPRFGPDKYPDRFLEYLSERRLYLV